MSFLLTESGDYIELEVGRDLLLLENSIYGNIRGLPGGAPNKKRKFAEINGTMVQVAGYMEAVELWKHFNQTEEEPTERELRYRIVVPKPEKEPTEIDKFKAWLKA